MRDFDKLAEAVFAGDMAAAEAVLDLMQATAGEGMAQAIRDAKRRARPELRARIELPEPEVFPRPGAKPGDYLDGMRRNFDRGNLRRPSKARTA